METIFKEISHKHFYKNSVKFLVFTALFPESDENKVK